MYSVNSKSQETSVKFCIKGSRTWIKSNQRVQLANQNIRTNNKSKSGSTPERGGGPQS